MQRVSVNNRGLSIGGTGRFMLPTNRILSNTIDPDALLFIENSAITTPSIQSAINTLVKDYKAGGVWNNLESCHPFVTDYKNQLTQSEDLSSADWGKVAVTVSSVSQNTPIGTSTCYKIIPTATTAWHYLTRTVATIQYEDTLVLSCYAKASGYDWLRLLIEDGAGGYARAWFNLTTGTVGTNNSSSLTLVSSSITAESDGFYRISITVSGNGRGLGIWVSPSSADNQTGTWLGDGTSGVLATGLQLEWDTLTSYESVTTSLIAEQFKLNLKNPLDTDAAHRIVWNSKLTGFSKKGFVGAPPVNNWGDIKLAPVTYLSQNDAHISITSQTNYGLGATWIDFGLFDTTGGAASFHITPDFSTQGMRVRINSSGATVLQFNASTIGTFMGNRTGSSDVELYVDGILVDEESVVSTGLSSLSMYIGAINQDGVAQVKTARRLTLPTTGKGLTAAQALAMKVAHAKFNTTLNR
jgi:hypothetical protein